MKWFEEHYLQEMKQDRITVLDVGSQDVNGTYKPLFPSLKYDYIGLDMIPGRNVDLVLENAYKWDTVESNSYDVVISGQAFEHMEFFWVTLSEMARVLKPNGYISIIVPRFQSRHRYPADTYRFDEDGMLAMARYCSLQPLHISMNMAPLEGFDNWYNPLIGDCLLVAQKPVDWKGLADLKTYSYQPPNLEKLHTGFVPEKQRYSFFPVMEKFETSHFFDTSGGGVIFGVGLVGKEILQYLTNRGLLPLALCDNNWMKLTPINGLPVISPEEAVQKFPEASFIVCSGFHENCKSMVEQLFNLGCKKIMLAAESPTLIAPQTDDCVAL